MSEVSDGDVNTALVGRWRSRFQAVEAALRRWPDGLQAPHHEIQLKVLAYLLLRYGDHSGPDFGEGSRDRSSHKPLAGLCESARKLRSPEELGGILERIARAAEGAAEIGPRFAPERYEEEEWQGEPEPTYWERNVSPRVGPLLFLTGLFFWLLILLLLLALNM